MDRFSDAEKRYIVMRLACFAAPKDVAKEVRELFDLDDEPSIPRICFYNPYTVAGSDRLDAELVQLFKDTRTLYKAAKDEIPIALQIGRFARLQGILDNIERNPILAVQIIELADKIDGGYHVRRPMVDASLPTGAGTDSLNGLAEDELDRRLDEARQRAGERAAKQ